jgi:hypothetical protein
MPKTRLLILLILFSLSVQGCTFPWLGFLLSPHPGDYSTCELSCIKEKDEQKEKCREECLKKRRELRELFPDYPANK